MPKAPSFEDLNFDSVTVARIWEKIQWSRSLPFENKHTIMLALTSNELLISNVTVDGKELYKQVLETLKPGRMQKT
jgi:orotidine-5'-phosphate decarboxylase